MPHDAPAALPLFAYAAALILGGSYRDACGIAIVAILLVALKQARAAVVVFALAAGLLVAAHRDAIRARDDATLARIDPDRFVVIDVPLENDWSDRGDVALLRADEFRADGVAIHRPLLIYARFAPPPIGMATTLRAEGFLRDGRVTIKSPRLMAYRGALSRWNPRRWNRALVQRVRPLAIAHPVEEALVEALALGRAERLDNATRDDYKRGGTYHLLVFSGLQIAVAAGFIALLLRWLHAPRTSDWSLLAFSILGPLFIGPTASVSRASIGVGVYALARILRRPTTLENLWCVAALLRLILAPDDLGDAAFHLTYAGAGALLFMGRRRWFVCAAAAELAVTPLTLFHFHQYALGGSIMTLLLTPLVIAMLVVALVVCAIPSAHVLAVLGLLHRLCTVLNHIAAPTSGFFAAPPAAALAISFGLALLAIALLPGRARAAAIAIALTIPTIAALYLGTRTPAGTHLTMLDVGQGDAILFRAGGKTLLVDGGPRPLTLLPLLADRGVHRVDVVVLSHVHPDHCGGLPMLVTRMRVGEVWVSPRRFQGDCAQQLLEACRAALVPIHLVRDGDVGPLGMRAFLADRTFRRAPENNASVVLQIGRVVLTGDVERDAEAEIAPRLGPADVLKIAHHGSRSSTTAPLLDAVRPRIALISCGRHNLFGHPHPSVLDALRARGIRVWRTDRDGTVDVEIRDGHLVVR